MFWRSQRSGDGRCRPRREAQRRSTQLKAWLFDLLRVAHEAIDFSPKEFKVVGTVLTLGSLILYDLVCLSLLPREFTVGLPVGSWAGITEGAFPIDFAQTAHDEFTKLLPPSSLPPGMTSHRRNVRTSSSGRARSGAVQTK